MTPAEHAQRIRQIELQLYIADNGMGMPRDYQRILYLRQLLFQAQKDAANDNALNTGYDILSDYEEGGVMTIEAQRTALVSMPVPKPTLSQVIIEKIREGATLEETKEYYRFLREIEADEQERQAKRAYDQERSLLEVELAPIATDCANPQTKSKYASLGQVIRAIRPLYSKHGIFVEFDTTESPKGEAWLRILALVSHRDGYSFQRQIDMPADGKGAQGRDVMTRAHAAMSAVTYGRRGLLLMIFNLAIGGEDDDGNAASRHQSNEGDDGRLISDAQVSQLIALLDTSDERITRFCKLQGIDVLGDMPASRFEGAVEAIKAVNAKRKAKAQEQPT